MEVPSSINFAMGKAPSVPATSVLRQFAANNGTTFSPTTNEIRINVAAQGFLDGHKSYLYFTINNLNAVAGQALVLDSDALCWCDQIRVESQGLVLERLERAAIYNNLRYRWQEGIGQIQARNAKCGGPALAAPSVGNSGQSIDEATSATFACPLPLGFLQNHGGKAIPKGASFDLVIRVNSVAGQCFNWESDAATSFSITNPRFYAPVMQVQSPEAMAEYQEALMSQGIAFSGDVVKTYVNSITAGAGSKVAQINDRSRSLKALVSVMRMNTLRDDADSSSVGASVLLGLTEYRYIIAGANYPQDTVQYSATDAGRTYEEAQKALAKDGMPHGEPTVSNASFVATGATGQGVIAVDLRSFDDKTLSMTGLNTAASAAPNTLELTMDANAVASDLTTYAICESIFVLDGRGGLTASA